MLQYYIKSYKKKGQSSICFLILVLAWDEEVNWEYSN